MIEWPPPRFDDIPITGSSGIHKRPWVHIAVHGASGLVCDVEGRGLTVTEALENALDRLPPEVKP